jgi:hypothetical protein
MMIYALPINYMVVFQSKLLGLFSPKMSTVGNLKSARKWLVDAMFLREMNCKMPYES